MDGRWDCHSNTNTYAGLGVPEYGIIDDDASSLKGVSLSTCQHHCKSTPDCGCVVHYKCPMIYDVSLGYSISNCEHGHVDGQCWRRTHCDNSTSKQNDEGFQMCNTN